MAKEISLSWDNVEMYCADIATAIARGDRPSYIVGISRGGLIPAAIIAHRLNIKRVYTIRATSYEGRKRGALHIECPLPFRAGRSVLIVDDVYDSGETFKAVNMALPGCDWAFTVLKDQIPGALLTTGQSTYHGLNVEKNAWVKFPWEA